ncbi:MAG: FAD binding domain-containing protein, partial [Pseudomonadota bacterium]
MYNFDYQKAGTVADAVSALADEDAQALSGGQTLLPTLKQRLGQPSKLVDLSRIAEMQGIDMAHGAFDGHA